MKMGLGVIVVPATTAMRNEHVAGVKFALALMAPLALMARIYAPNYTVQDPIQNLVCAATTIRFDITPNDNRDGKRGEHQSAPRSLPPCYKKDNKKKEDQHHDKQDLTDWEPV
ncbi:hypothetical protein Tco_0133868 [Tanacetum coccineum]